MSGPGQTLRVHGGDLDAARQAFPDAPAPWIDLSTGINPNPYPVPELASEVWTRLPQSGAERALRCAAARRYGAANPEMIAAAPGTQALLQIIPRMFAPANVAILSPTYAEHAASWRLAGHDVREVTELDCVKSANVVVVVNPNNPTGRVFAAEELCAIAHDLSDRGATLIVDEAFADVMPAGTSIVPNLPRSAIVLRSFGKMYGLPGLRLGFAIACEETIANIRKSLGAWPVSGPALAVGTEALSDDDWLDTARATLIDASRRLQALLQENALHVVGGTPLFQLASHPMARTIADALGRSGIYVRRFPERPEWLRFGVPGAETEWQRLRACLASAV